MPLENSDCIDMIVATQEGRLQLVITDSGETSAPERRLQLFQEKVKTYAAYLSGKSFEAEHPGKHIADCDIVAMTRIAPTDALLKLSTITGPLIFKMFNPEDNRVNAPSTAAQNPSATSSPSSLLFKASAKNDFNLLKSAVNQGAQLTSPDPLGLFPIYYAVHHGNVEMLEYIFSCGAGFPEKTVGGRSLWINAHAKGFTRIEEILVSHGVKPGFSDRLVAGWMKLKAKMSAGQD
jgi:hypothetical protein